MGFSLIHLCVYIDTIIIFNNILIYNPGLHYFIQWLYFTVTCNQTSSCRYICLLLLIFRSSQASFNFYFIFSPFLLFFPSVFPSIFSFLLSFQFSFFLFSFLHFFHPPFFFPSSFLLFSFSSFFFPLFPSPFLAFSDNHTQVSSPTLQSKQHVSLCLRVNVSLCSLPYPSLAEEPSSSSTSSQHLGRREGEDGW